MALRKIHHRTRHSGGRQPRSRAAAGRRGQIERRLAPNSAPTSNGSRACRRRQDVLRLPRKDEAIIKQHAEISGLPGHQDHQVRKMIDPTNRTRRLSQRRISAPLPQGGRGGTQLKAWEGEDHGGRSVCAARLFI